VSHLPLERRRTHPTGRRVPAPLVIEHFRVVVAVAAPAHAAGDAVDLEDGLVVFAGVRGFLIGVMEEADVGAAALHAMWESISERTGFI
jgi:hypothetical protein